MARKKKDDGDYADLLNTSFDEIPDVSTLPDGSYRLKARNAKYYPAKEEDKNPFVMVVYQVLEPMDDVDEEALSALGENYDLEGNRIFWRKYIESGADWHAFRRHAEKHGVDPIGDGGVKKTPKELMADLKGTEVIAMLSTRSFVVDGETREENVASEFTPAD